MFLRLILELRQINVVSIDSAVSFAKYSNVAYLYSLAVWSYTERSIQQDFYITVKHNL
jgi:hypothetical protein